MNITFIIGNGFNFLIEEIVRSIPENQLPKNLSSPKNEIADKIHEISTLWRKFDEIFNEVKENVGGNVNDEELIKIIQAVLEFLSNAELFKKIIGEEKLAELTATFDIVLIDKIKAICEEFRQHEISEGYKDIKRIFPDFGERFKKILDASSVTNCDFITTNYDGVLDTLLTKSTKGFLSVDGFGRIPGLDNYLKLYDYNLYGYQIRCLHLHGSYRFQKINGDTYKTKDKSVINEDPVIVFNNPNQKEMLIRSDHVLRQYFSEFCESLKNSNKLVIIGNSLKNEPHLKEKISEHFNRPNKKLYVCSRNPDQIANQLNGFYSHPIIKKPTADIATKEHLINFFDEIIKDTPQQ